MPSSIYILYYVVLYYMKLYCILLFYTILYYTILYYIYYITLYYILHHRALTSGSSHCQTVSEFVHMFFFLNI